MEVTEFVHAHFGDRDDVLGATGLAAEEVGREAARKALAKLGATAASTGRVPAVVHREVVAGLLDAISPAFSARRVIKGMSTLAGRIGQAVASPVVTLVEDPRLEGSYGASPIDGEGHPTERLTLIEEGRMAAYLQDSYSSIKTGVGRPGNTIRALCAGSEVRRCSCVIRMLTSVSSSMKLRRSAG